MPANNPHAHARFHLESVRPPSTDRPVYPDSDTFTPLVAFLRVGEVKTLAVGSE